MPNVSGMRQLASRSWFSPWEKWLDKLPLPVAEDSLPLRVLVQLLVIVGIVATDLAATDITSEWTITSYWAIPASVVGAAWSWYRRRDRNVSTKFCLAIGMLLVLAAFFVRLLGELNDTRLALAQLLIQLQVLHSFDLPRRKDLGYSMVIGLILLGVAGTLSQTLAFGPMLLLFIAIALPVLVLDYRSRLGLIFQGFRRLSPDLAPKRLGWVLVVTLCLGLTIFALLPRLPGYQIRSFPVSAPREFEGEFDTSRILNPGYVGSGRSNRPGQGSGPGEESLDLQGGQGRGPGQLDSKFYYGFSSQINQNLRGLDLMKPEVVLRVRSQAKGFWRVLGFDRYTGQGWEISRNNQAEKIGRPVWTYQFILPRPLMRGRTQEIVQTYTVVADELPNVIPALSQPKELYFPTRQIGVDPEGSLRSPLGLVAGFTYTVVSEVPYRDRTLLGQASTAYPPGIRSYYLQLPPEIAPKIRQKTEAILAKAPNPLTNPYEKALYLAQYLKQNYLIKPDLPFLGETDDLAEAFLFRYQGGYPDHFSTVYTVMLRSIGIPARLATGFGSGEFNPFTGMYVVKNTDAYAITEVYFPKYGWFGFDPIPGHELYPPTLEESQTLTILEQFWKWIAGWLPSPVANFLGTLFTYTLGWISRALGWLLGLFSQGWLGVFSGLLVTIGLAFAAWLGWSGWQTWRYQLWLSQLSPMERLYQQLLDWLATQGFRKQAYQTPLEYADQLRQQAIAPYYPVIAEISQAYVGWRYGRQQANLPELQRQFKSMQAQVRKAQWRLRRR